MHAAISDCIGRFGHIHDTKSRYVSCCHPAQMLQQGFHPDSADYDNRTALMLAAVKGHCDVAVALLSAGADYGLHDNLRRCALMEACQGGHGDVIELLTRQGATCALPTPFLFSHA